MKNVLLIMPLSYNYNNVISNALVEKGFTVKFIPDFDESVAKRFFRKFLSIGWWQHSYIISKLKSIKNFNPDWILLIRGYNYNYRTTKYIKDMFPKSKITMYQWDPLCVSKFDKNGLVFFDTIYSFDRGDCIKYHLNYLPLFYKLNTSLDKTKIIYDFSFIGSGHSQRLFVIGNLIKEFKSKNYSYFIIIYINKLEYLRGWILNRPGYRNFPKENLSFKPIDKSFSESIVNQSKIILDVNHPDQKGLSIRVLEVLGAQKKIITTNKEILKESFYSSNVIGIIEDSKLPNNINKMLKDSSIINVEKYEINNWINNLLPNNKL